VASYCEYGDEPSGSGATDWVSYFVIYLVSPFIMEVISPQTKNTKPRIHSVSDISCNDLLFSFRNIHFLVSNWRIFLAHFLC
jgi:hypothetical protein